MTDSSDLPGNATAHDVIGVVRFRLERLPSYEQRFARAIRAYMFSLAAVLLVALGMLALVPVLGLVALWLSVLLLMVGVVPAYALVSSRRFRAGLPRVGGPDVALAVRRSGIDVSWPDLGPARLASLTWGDLTNLGQRGPLRGTSVLRIRTHRRPAGSWTRVAYLPQDLLDTPIDLIVRDVQALVGGAVRT
ncbi:MULTISPECIES: hypothetical protein [Mumia]|uniref:hypothetical protein n=1 Tax=Mumia TaxID=1546255 RepID=UPI0014223F42|nr:MULTISPECIES: hypothetical protein [unclassified Mumia]QMW66806.1 hypothetical protein H4N58_02260 [Mumia sp. ZJ1417]